MKQERLKAVPTNVITGFLGAGKSSAILQLLAQKPADERWAVLINEFGEIGIDGSLVQGKASAEQGIYIKEVPGGCMCCAAGLPMQIALTLLLKQAQPQRLLIEPTGLGHPVEVMQTLSAEYNREVLSLQKTVTVLDARKLKDERYTSHPTFVQQFDIADVVVANKEDLYTEEDHARLYDYINSHVNPKVELLVTSHGKFGLEHLAGAPAQDFQAHVNAAHASAEEVTLASEQPFPDSGVVRAVNEGEGFASIGWRFSPVKVFDKTRLRSFLAGLDVERMKAVFITQAGIFGYNMTRDALTEVAIDECLESRIEIIADQIDADWEAALEACLVS